ncbi:MAG: corrinoid protein [Candidatus Tectomicrobia bacterium]|nr:corrinoid protein [Candidatus Tectomicrobia bacterium]
MADTSEQLTRAILELREEEVLQLVRQRLAAGEAPLEIIAALRQGVAEVGQKFEKGEYFLTELIMAGKIFKEAMVDLEPALERSRQQSQALGTVVIGTVKGDLHDIGKNIVIIMLRSAGFLVHDLGIDVPPQTFVNKVREVNADLLGLSGLLTVSFNPMKETVAAMHAAGLRERCRIMIGGGPTDERVRAYTGADYVGQDAGQAVRLAKAALGVA